MEVVLIRHLSTPGNEKRQYIGSTDEDLSPQAVERFRQMQGTAAPVLAGGSCLLPGWVVVSPMKRCIRTAELIWPGRKVCPEPLLKECDFGAYEGKTYEELKDEPAYREWIAGGGMTAFPGGESQTAFRKRCREGIRKWILKALEEDVERIFFVVHGGTIMSALSAYAEEDGSDAERNGSPSEDAGKFYRWQVENGGGCVCRAVREEWMNGRYILHDVENLGQGRSLEQ